MSASVHRRINGGDGLVPITAADVAAHTGGRLIGDPTVRVYGISPLDLAESDELSVFSHARYAEWFSRTKAGVVVVASEFAETPGPAATRVVVDKPGEAMLGLLAHFLRPEPRASGVHPTAIVAPSAEIGAGVTIDAYAVIADGVSIGDRSWIGAGVSVGAGSTIGNDVRIYHGATLYAFVDVGDRVIVHAGARIGRDGFGFVPGERGVIRVPHVGRCVLEHDVEVGANSTVDRGSIDDTIIGAGTKIDNLVQIAHNVRIGRGCFIAANVGIAGSTRIGDRVQMGGQSGVGGHVTIGAGANVAARGGVISDMPAGETWSGFPARPHKEQMRNMAALTRLSRLLRPLERLLAREDAS